MDDVISFVKGAEISSLKASDRICYAIELFIQVLELNDLGEAITQASKNHEKVVKKIPEKN